METGKHMDSTWDEEVDVAIVGTGLAGMAAALELANTNSSFIVLEKMAETGGSSFMDSGELSIVGSPQQRRHNIGDSSTLLAQDMMVNGDFQNSPEIIRYIAQQSYETYQWLTDQLGVKWAPGIGQAGGHSVPRTISTQSGHGLEIHQAMNAKLLDMNIQPRKNCFAQNIVIDADGNVEGLVVREGYKYPCSTSGIERKIKVRQGLILAHGGITAEAFYRSSQFMDLTPASNTDSSPASLGNIWEECSKIGCYLIFSDWIRDSWNNPLGKSREWKFSEYAAATFGLWVNSEGHRFVNEAANRKIRSDAVSRECLRNLKVFGIANQSGVQSLEEMRPGYLKAMLENGLIRKYDQLDELEKKEGFPEGALKREINEFNRLAQTRLVDKFGRILRNVKPLEKGAWYIATICPRVHRYVGGLVIDACGRVLSVKTHKPIGRLYAAGGCISIIHGTGRLGSCSTLESLVMGRTAGRHAAQQPIINQNASFSELPAQCLPC